MKRKQTGRSLAAHAFGIAAVAGFLTPSPAEAGNLPVFRFAPRVNSTTVAPGTAVQTTTTLSLSDFRIDPARPERWTAGNTGRGAAAGERPAHRGLLSDLRTASGAVVLSGCRARVEGEVA